MQEIKGFGPKRLSAMAEKGIRTSEDLLAMLPRGYHDATHPVSPGEMVEGREAVFEGFVRGNLQHHYANGRNWVSGTISDGFSSIRCMWFNQPWMREKLKDNDPVLLYGKAVRKKNGLFVINPSVEEEKIITPIYRTIPGVGQKTLRDAIALLLKEEKTPDFLPAEIRDRLQLMEHHAALAEAHFPTSTQTLEAAKKRLAFDELLLFQAAIAGQSGVRSHTVPLPIRKEDLERFVKSLPFRPTGAQQRAMEEIAADLGKDVEMARLLQGDVGCGKTMVAFASLYLCVCAGGQGAMMAPTEILARQHFESAAEMLSPLGITCGLLTGHMTAAERRRALEAIACGEWQVVIGTHALISEDVQYRNLKLVVTDEQHRFGVRQRSMLEEKGENPHVLVMSATPIPRTLSLILYGDLDLTVIDELPPGRQPVRTRIVPEAKRDGLYRFIEQQKEAGHQTYVVCPMIGEDADEEDEEGRNAVAELKELTEKLHGCSVGLVHGKMRPQEKEDVLSDFYSGQLDVLIATTVIEVGVNVPNATVMVIEEADHFGLAQLHQLRGRVGRGSGESWCFLMADPNERLRILTETEDGFKVASKDLELRGAGDYFGTKQSGEPAMPALCLTADTAVLEQARETFLMLCRREEYRETYQGLSRRAEQKYRENALALARN